MKELASAYSQRDVAIVGAGPSGLAAATALRKAGLSVAVIEARDRVGGRTWTDTIDGAVLEIGGQWVSPDQTALISLLDELGLKTFERYRGASPSTSRQQASGLDTRAIPSPRTRPPRRRWTVSSTRWTISQRRSAPRSRGHIPSPAISTQSPSSSG